MDLETLPVPQVRALRLAWDATRGGTVGVGAVIHGPSGEALGEGQNQIFAPGPGILANNRLAHAEMNAIAACRAGTTLVGATIWTTLEPCIMCASALVLSKVASVNVLSVDPFQSDAVDALSNGNEWVRRSWPDYVYSDERAWTALARVMSLHLAVASDPEGTVARQAMALEPELHALTCQCVADGLVAGLADQPLEALVERLRPALMALE